MPKPDKWIIKQCQKDKPLITPFISTLQSQGLSYGLSSAGYDVRIASSFRLFVKPIIAPDNYVIDPKNFDDIAIYPVDGVETLILPPHSFCLGYTVEKINMPKNIIALCVGKSSYARVGIIINTTPIEPTWSGHVTIEISNTNPNPVKIYANEGIAQIMFFDCGEVQTSYSDRRGKYQDQPAEVVYSRGKK
jgi:dCTP deaminase